MAEQTQLRGKPVVDVDLLAEKWFNAVATTSYVPLPKLELRRRFGELAVQVIAYMDADEPAQGQAEAIGDALAQLWLVQPESLGRTQELLAGELLAGLPAEQAVALHSRLAKLLGGLATGFSKQSQQIILAHQEGIRQALVMAQQQAGKALQESEDRHRKLVQVLPVGVAVLKGGYPLVANQAMADILKASRPEDLYDQPIISFIHPDFRELAQSLLDELAGSTDGLQQSQYRFTRLDGTVIDVEAMVYRFDDLDEPALRVVMRDITESKRAAEALGRSERLFRDLAETTQAFIAVVKENRAVYVNAIAAKLTGYSLEELYDLPLERLVPPEDYEQHLGLFRRWRAGGPDIVPFETQIVTKSGARSWMEVSLSQIEYAGEPALLTTAFDITERKRTEAALRESEALFRTLAETTTAAIFLYKGDRHIYANTAAVRIVGYSVEELLNMAYIDTIHPDYRDLVRQRATARLSNRPTVKNYQVPLLTKSGEVRWVDYTGNTIEYHGEPAGLGTAFDITELRQTQETLRQYAQRLELLSEVDRASLTDRSKRVIASTALQLIGTLVPADRVSVTELGPGEEWHTVIAVWPTEGTAIGEGHRLPLNQWERVRQEQNQGCSYIPDIDVVPSPSLMQQKVRAEGIRAYIAMPLMFRDRLLGYMNVGSSSPDAYSSNHIQVIQEVAQRLAIALQNAQLFDELEASWRHLQELSRQLVRVQEAERRYIARELHDEVAQTLTALNINLELASHLEVHQRSERLAEAQSLLRMLSAQVRELSLRLRPAMLDDFGLLPTLLWYFDRLWDQFHLKVIVEHQGLDHRFDPEVETVVYRIVQEALTNVVRYGGVMEAFVRLWASADTVSVQIEDRGAGFDPSGVLQRQESSGVSGMRERARLLGGQFVLDSSPGAGTCITVLLPISQPLQESK